MIKDGSFSVQNDSKNPKDLDDSTPSGGMSFQDLMHQQEERQQQLRYVQEFLNNPMLIELGDSPVSTSSTKEEIEARRRDLTYRVDVLGALMAIFMDELDVLDRFQSTSDD